MAKVVLSDEQKLAAFLALAETDFDNIEDLPEYGKFPSGGFELMVTGAEINTDDGYFDFRATLTGVLAVEDKQQTVPIYEAPALESLYAERFYGAMGIQRLKALFSPVYKQLEVKTLVELANKLEGNKVIVRLNSRWSKKMDRNQTNMTEIMIAP